MRINEMVLGKLGHYIDIFFTWQFSHFYIAIPMTLLELFILLKLYLLFRTTPPII